MISHDENVLASDCSLPYVVTLAFAGGTKPSYVVLPAAAAGPWQSNGAPPNPWPGYLHSCPVGVFEPGYIFITSDQECKQCTLFHAPTW
jgi:hypothetical protein